MWLWRWFQRQRGGTVTKPEQPDNVQNVDGATTDDSNTDHAPQKPSKPRGIPGGFRLPGPNLAEIKARVRHRRTDSSPEDEDRGASQPAISQMAGPPIGFLSSKKETTPPPPAADFSKPAKATTLSSVTKSRAKIQRPRRPPTRRPGASAAKAPEPEVEKPAAKFEAPEAPAAKTDTPAAPAAKPEAPAASTPPKKPQEAEENLDGPPPLPPTPPEDEESPEVNPMTIAERLKEDVDEDDLFSPLPARTATPPVRDDSPVVMRHAAPRDPDDVLFGDLTIDSSKKLAETPRHEEGATSAKIETKNAKIDKDEDLFASITARESLEKTKKTDAGPSQDTTKKKKAVLLNDEDDLFGSLVHESKTVETKKVAEAKKEGQDEEEDDIFNTKGSSKTKSQRGIATDDLFADDTDIFADIPAPTERSKSSKTKPKAKTTPKTKAPAKAVEQEDIDDIFAESKAAPSSTKTAKKKKVRTSKPVSADNGGDIFDDPLNALQ